ncbi:xanthine phosphoribosyltransferase [Aristaeella hokkaidonensis]|jgi:xanthine phosphoribosyltransferase|uniref:Xanthine phosphoribosyltransferase n=1 Tax=Aristaeella hokkaidonensis TaxID=3046382 RepID=A0AC61N5H1_9FIRM|nr:xanthine phosphoribosyltransferase [Aristaeella hokkaidonensis]QTE70722.1 xanthine phosphoribosyltransferase [Clostridiales bacterium FE2011]QUC68505.1 xanthine phosphoribosyltransferase [Aristaeella hokkaidonensis]SNT94983.1 xanthine phosphoribosyltransferase [Aristaeella hokkaidonensis]
MEALRRMILEKGKGIGNDIVKVDMFLNHRIDTALLFQMGEAWADEFRNEKPEIVLTVEASGIAMAVAAAHALGDIPVVFAKKSATAVQNDETVQAPVYSFTHKKQNIIRIEKQYLPEGTRVLIIDDFLADGQAVHGLMSLCEQQKATVVGVGIAVEKGFQPGGKALRESGIHLKSLAVVEGIENGNIVLRPEDD